MSTVLLIYKFTVVCSGNDADSETEVETNADDETQSLRFSPLSQKRPTDLVVHKIPDTDSTPEREQKEPPTYWEILQHAATSPELTNNW